MNTIFNLDLLRAFVAVVDSRSFTAAALQLHSTQSTVSQKIMRLEDAAEQALLDRARHDVRPTDAGEKLLGYARRILHLHDEAAAAMAGTALASVFRLGLPEDFASRLVTPALARFMRAHPNTKLEVTSGLSRDLQKGFETGEFDLVMVKQKRGETAGVMHWPEPLSWLDSADFPVSHVDPLPLVVFPPNGLYRSDMMEALDRAGRRWHVVFTSSSLASIQSAVAEGLGVSLLPTRVALPGHRAVPAAAGLPSVEPMEIVIRHMDNGSSIGGFDQIRQLAEMLAEIVGE
ncbi:LysR family transcriptional regulator [Brucella anthropi]|uniref:LysR substrate-binding domain-containing protein n=1 Tax=Brucella anthropi TaxID=529 RepID=UPI003987D1EA